MCTPLQVNASKPLIGLNLMSGDPISIGNLGCRFVMFVHTTPNSANMFKRAFPDAVVMFRNFIAPNHIPSPQQMFDLLQITPDSELVYTGLNENEQICSDPNKIRERAAFDVAVAKLVKAVAPKAVYAAGSFATLTPNFSDPAVCEAMREGYADSYNHGLIGFDMHLYSRDFDHIFGGDLVEENNWRNLFTHCGFDPTRRAIYSGETGIDGIFGNHLGSEQFTWKGIDHSMLIAWMKRWLEVQKQPISVGSTIFPSPIVGGAIFQCVLNDARWNPFDISFHLNAMREVWNE